ncbi:family 16 glycosylhydrolase [Algibacter amylolyticus]|uniref:Family 16 glycosylhydrolase n=1 Tax=Algibacter amylolyticus TaxID=1608400 RepID=A0A5M7B2G2_9FLAO|nr:family 16 glycosylhydrolase [Algibacter amylolyticus]KAA5823753.1 family 16 glycosylhydrolase [Algibacter amylolyticus]MBB5267925.1 beta-glucanase (GH16 family) [Algibacter amylolyticus]TSJ74241.1 family 16 glycosylhydrolase [Algibacter amylolyticus]
MKIVHFTITLLILVFGLFIQSCGSSNDSIEEDIQKEEPENEDPKEETITCNGQRYSTVLPSPTEQFDISKWNLIWEDEFDYDDSKLEDNWASQNNSSGHILCSRWRENAVVKDGVIELQARKEQRGGQDWTCGNIWTKETFGYGYFEAKYKYAGASGTNNSFWLFSKLKGTGNNSEGVTCELDVNEGHFPNEVNTNRHHWEGGTSIDNSQQAYAEGLSPGYAHTLEEAVKTKHIRFSSHNANHFHIREFRIYEASSNCNYPEDILSNNADNSVAGLNNLSKDSQVTITSSGVLNDTYNVNAIADGSTATSWVSQKEGEKWLEFEWPSEQNIGHIQFINGWQSGTNWNTLISDYKIEAFVNNQWVEVGSYDVKDEYDFSTDYHKYGMDWSASGIKFYFDDKLIRTIPNNLCDEELNIYLSLAILEHAGEVTDAADGTSMKIDYVRYYKEK